MPDRICSLGPKDFFRECFGTEEGDWEAWSSEFPDAWADDANAQGPKVSRPFAQYPSILTSLKFVEEVESSQRRWRREVLW